MKIVLLTIVLFCFGAFAGSGKSKQEVVSLTEIFKTTTNAVLVNVKGMVCDFCAQGLKEKFGPMSEVENIDVDLVSGNVLVKLKQGKQLSDAKITKAVEENGLEVISINKK